ncbi:MAG: UDP-N-acetylglucosamine 1-carboxyvinyltransferase, partial [Candidatus Wallbacteria bacterium]|nr:UDP-N-acetylglucosamine 1-carboxyvinyltransferase [Candidatus Wallbacteria bacterium]
EVTVSGAKNAALPVLAGCLLVSGETVLHNVPRLQDISTMIKLLSILGAKCRQEDSTLYIDTSSITVNEAPYSLVKTMRASFIILGPLLGRLKSARVALPGGCAIGTRPVDIHIKGLQALSAEVEIQGGYVEAKVKKLKGNTVHLDFPSVGATENIMLAAALSEGETIIRNSAREPEIVNLGDFINRMGGHVRGAGSDEIIVQGVSRLHPSEFTIMPDRIETGTLISAAAITKGDIIIRNASPTHLESVIGKLSDAGVEITCSGETIHARSSRRISSVPVRTLPYPGFPTDLQPQLMAVLCLAEGASIISETIFENRFMQVPELIRMGASIKVEERNAMIEGVKKLSGAEVMCSDLRAGASLVLAALAADGVSLVQRIYHIDRGYECLEQKLSALGAKITRVRAGM